MDTCATQRISRILLTGPPGIGKTTICKKIVKIFEKYNFNYDGFYTEEIRSSDKSRIGFDIVPLKNSDQRNWLARTEAALEGRKPSKIKVGNYLVFVDKFESVALPSLQSKSDILMIDEIGKMELFSKQFCDSVEKLFLKNSSKTKFIVATIPAKNRVPQRHRSLFEKLYQRSNCKIYEVNRQNRDKLPEEIESIIKVIMN
ncbi:GSCOCG00001608001-RA-CDS [Cotesia congregata]|uniref:Similar to Ntpcr: Cancer-related nucleoside-triphosphatase homolog (Mus musculus) n=1 Tax=Cotesia congregata TaxID=51543 RepID=A0A8J2HQJ3_COTCN|nr:GSCOCG00001608001-RA-CDS [Cotesia congregata]CAG5106852.1 Similar to Ntpcr: Cancer-related nucleoside-triphosphatase homolog (Mus musculus) [Cotesia congregata]